MKTRQSLIDVKVAKTNALVRDCLRIRYHVYVEELGWEPENEDKLETDDLDEGALHVLATYNGDPAGTMRILWANRFMSFSLERICGITLPDEDKQWSVEISRNCVLKQYRHHGIMSAMIEWFIKNIISNTTLSRVYMLNNDTNKGLLTANDIRWVDCGICVEHKGMREVAYVDIVAELKRKGLL